MISTPHARTIIFCVSLLLLRYTARAEELSFDSRGSEDGYVRESLSAARSTLKQKRSLAGVRSNTDEQGGGAIVAGDDGSNRQLKGFLSFDSAPIPDDAEITGAALRLTRGKYSGNPATLGNLFVDLKKGSFGGSQTLDGGDFNASATLEKIISIPLASGTFEVALPDAALQHINQSGRTQLRLSFTKSTNRDKKATQIGFYSGEANDRLLRPKLVVTYRVRATPSPLPTVSGSATSTPTPLPATPSPTATSTPIPTSTPPGRTLWRPQPGTSWQWQLTGTLNTSFNVQMYDIDLFTTSEQAISQLKQQGRKVVCYFSAGSFENFRPDKDLFPPVVLGKSNGWPGEKWLDIRRLDLLGPILLARLDLAVQKGCDGVEPDNVDGYTNSTGFPLTYTDQLAFNRFLSRAAHERGLSVGLKNDLDQVKDLVNDFDWALNEQCFQYDECDLLLPFIRQDKAVFGVEYQGSTSTFCPKANAMNLDWLKKGLDLDAARESCR